MTTHVARQAKGDIMPKQTDQGVEVVVGYLPAAHGLTIAQNDIIQMVKVPVGAMVIDCLLLTGAWGSSVTADVGDGDTEDLYISAVDVSAASITRMESVGLAGVLKEYTAEDTIDVKLEGANPTDATAMTLIVWYIHSIDITP